MEILMISTLPLSSLKNAEHVQYHANVRTVIENTGLERIGLSELVFNPYTQAIQVEQDVVNHAAGLPYTQEMDAADKTRDLIFRRLRHKLCSCELEEEGTLAREMAPLVKKHLLSKYPGNLVNLAYQEETAHLSGMIMDCNNLFTEEQKDTLGIAADIAALEQANNQFNDLYQNRVAEKATANTMLSSDLRNATDKAYTRLILTLNQQGNDLTPANEAKTSACRDLMGKINVIITDARTRLNQRLSTTPAGEGDDNKPSGNGSGTGSGSGSGSGTGSGSGKPGGLIIPDEVIE